MGLGEQWNCDCSLTEARARRPGKSSGEDTRDVEPCEEGGTRQGEGRSGFYPGLGHQGQRSFHAIIYQFLKVRDHFLGRVFAVGYWIDNQGQTEASTPDLVRGQPGGSCSGLARWQMRPKEGGVRGTKRKNWRNKYCKRGTVSTWSDMGDSLKEGSRSERKLQCVRQSRQTSKK